MSKRKLSNYIIIGIIIIIVLLFVLIPSWRAEIAQLIQLNSMEDIRDFVDSMGAWGPIVLIVLMILHSVTFIPFEVILFADLVLFGPVWGVVYSWIGLMLGAYLSFLVARALGRPAVKRFVSTNMVERFDGFVQRDGSKGLLVLRLIPFVSFNALNYAAGLTSLSLWTFLWTTGVGVLPLNILFAFVYQSAAGQKYTLIGLTIAGVLLLIMLLLKVKKSQKIHSKHKDEQEDVDAKSAGGIGKDNRSEKYRHTDSER